MSHDHSHDTENIKTAFFLNLGFTIFELIGGLYVNSVAILSDAIHDLGDSLSLGISWYLQKLSHKGRTKILSYGYKRFSVLSAIINAFVLLAGSIFILYSTIPRLLDPVQPDAEGMIILSIIGVVVNGAAVFKTKDGKSINEKVVSLHLLEDVLGWAAVLLGSIAMTFMDIPILDPLLSVLIAFYILYNVYKNLKSSFKIILQSIPEEINMAEIENKLLEITEVESVHDLHTWSMDGAYHVMTVHLALNSDLSLDQCEIIKNKARNILQSKDIDHVTIELESINVDCQLLNC